MGHNDGTVKGRRIFDCPDGFGAFVRGFNIKIGDYPERDIFASDDENEVENVKKLPETVTVEDEEEDEDEL